MVTLGAIKAYQFVTGFAEEVFLLFVGLAGRDGFVSRGQ